MKLEDWIVVAGLLIFAIGCIIPWPYPWAQTTVVGIILTIIGLVAGSDTLKKGEPEPSKRTIQEERKDIVELCPLCGAQLEKGYIASKMIVWGDKKISDESFNGWIMGGGFVALGAETIVSRGWPYPITNVEACRCKKCKLIIFRYGKT